MSTAAGVTVPRNYIQAGHISIGVTATSYDLESSTATAEVLIAIAGTWSTPKALFPTYKTSRCALFW